MDVKKSLASIIKGLLSCVPNRPPRVIESPEPATNAGVYSTDVPRAIFIPGRTFARVEPDLIEHIPNWNVMPDLQPGDEYEIDTAASSLYARRWIRYVNQRSYRDTCERMAYRYAQKADVAYDSDAASPCVVP